MNKVIRRAGSVVIIVASLAIVSCKDNSEKSENSEMTEGATSGDVTSETTENNAQAEVKSTGMVAFNDESVAKAYQDYIALKDALVNTNPSQAAQAATSLQASAPSEIGSIAQQISSSEDINKQRELFSQITAKMEPVLEGKISSGEIYKQYCPMAFEGKGDYWFSDSKQIRNPYFGDKMLNCGRVEKTIN